MPIPTSNINNKKLSVYATTAQLPGLHFKLAIALLNNILNEPLWGKLKTQYIQICPQSFGQITSKDAKLIVEQYPDTHFRLHANARVLEKHVLWDISSFNKDNVFYYKKLIDIMKIFNEPFKEKNVISLHAGYQKNCTKKQCFENIKKLNDLFYDYSKGNITFAVEGLYPNKKVPQHINSWSEYEELFKTNVSYALDLSHLNIVAHKEKIWNMSLIKEMILSNNCKEIHVSGNNGSSDSHEKLNNLDRPYWLNILDNIFNNNKNFDIPLIFSEGKLLPRIGKPEWWEHKIKNIKD